MKYHVIYTDGSEQEYETLEQTEQGIMETVTGCDFAVTVKDVFAIDGEKRLDFEFSWTVTVSLAPRALVGLHAGLRPSDSRDGGSDLGRVSKQVLRADRANSDRPRAQGHRHRSLRHRKASGIRFWLPALPGHVPGSGFLVGIDSCHSHRTASGPANDLGRPNPAGRVGWLQGVYTASPLQADSWGVVSTLIGRSSA